MHNHTKVIYIQYKFHEIPSIDYKNIMAEDGKKSLKFRQSKGNNSSITEDILMKIHTHNHTMVLFIQHKFHEIPSIGYLVMAEDGKTDGRTDGRKHRTEGRTDNAKPIFLRLLRGIKTVS